MAVLYSQHFAQFFDNNGDPLSGGKLYTYSAGTTTPKATYTAADGLTANANPVILDSSGRATIFLNGSYKFTLKTSADVLVEETDNITSFSVQTSTVDNIISNFTEDVIQTGDSVIFSDLSDGGETKRDTVQGVLDLVKSSTRQYLTSGTSATYTTPANCKKIRVRMIGGGGGGSAFATNAGSTGGTTSFGSFTAIGGGGGTLSGAGANGGTGGSGTALIRVNGARGEPSDTTSAHGGFGGGTFLIGSTTGGAQNSAGLDAQANTGAGGQGASSAGSSKGGGGAGEYVEFEIASPASTYTYTIGAGGAGGAAGTTAGGNGGSGIIIVEEFYGA